MELPGHMAANFSDASQLSPIAPLHLHILLLTLYTMYLFQGKVGGVMFEMCGVRSEVCGGRL